MEVRLWDGKIEEFQELPKSWHKHLINALKIEDKVMRGREAIFPKKYEEVSGCRDELQGTETGRKCT